VRLAVSAYQSMTTNVRAGAMTRNELMARSVTVAVRNGTNRAKGRAIVISRFRRRHQRRMTVAAATRRKAENTASPQLPCWLHPRR
jgi:hypothetical protein